jgi:hypothetical protein
LIQLFAEKPVWTQKDLLLALKPYDDSLIRYILQNAIAQGFKLKDRNGRLGRLEAKKGVFAFAIGDNETMLDRLVPKTVGTDVPLSDNTPLTLDADVEMPQAVPDAAPEDIGIPYEGIQDKVETYDWFGNHDDTDRIKKSIDKANESPKKTAKNLEKIKNLEEELRKLEALEKKRLDDFLSEYPYDVREWFYVDQVLKGDERKDHILKTFRSGQIPAYLQSMVVNGPEKFYVFGPDEFYTADGKKFVPIGASLDAYNAWRSDLKDRFINGKDNFFAAMKEDVIVFNIDDKLDSDKKVKHAERTKVIGGRSCSFFEETVINAFAKWFGTVLEAKTETNAGHTKALTKEGLPFLTKQERCRAISMLARKAVFDRKAWFDWYTPEEWAVLTEETTRKEVLARLNPKKK